MDTYKVSRRSATRRLLFSVALLGTVTLSAPISVVAATDGFSVLTMWQTDSSPLIPKPQKIKAG